MEKLYGQSMPRRTTIDIDDALLARAQAALGTRGLKDTVDTALRAAVRQSARARLAARIASGAGIDRSEALLAQTRPER
jgi:Arc/MetJ family transcription regulator